MGTFLKPLIILLLLLPAISAHLASDSTIETDGYAIDFGYTLVEPKTANLSALLTQSETLLPAQPTKGAISIIRNNKEVFAYQSTLSSNEISTSHTFEAAGTYTIVVEFWREDIKIARGGFPLKIPGQQNNPWIFILLGLALALFVYWYLSKKK